MTRPKIFRASVLAMAAALVMGCGSGDEESATDSSVPAVAATADPQPTPSMSTTPTSTADPTPTAVPTPSAPPATSGSPDCDQLSGNATMLCRHNEVRTQPDPVPSPDLQALVWDEQLALVAQAHAENCNFEHNDNRHSDYAELGGSGSVGENVYVTSNSGAAPDSAVAPWADEARHYNYERNRCALGQVCGHYTQLVWRDTSRVGCGAMACGSVSGFGGRSGLLVVCNYAPAGNFVGQRPY